MKLHDSTHDYISRLKNGCILLSHEDLEDPNFKITVVLLCVYDKDGVFGLVLNRPSHMPLREVFDIDSIFDNEKRSMYIGGPLQQEVLHILQITDEAASGAMQLALRVFVGGEWDTLETVLSEECSTTRLFLGYSGWSQGQIEEEIIEGAWEVYNVDLEKFLTQWEEPMFQDIDKIRSYLKEITLSSE